jgi:GDP-4-dehydro-6-deoxy-D-mannose reductase
MRTLVTGGDGFVGQYLIRELLASGADLSASVQRLPPRPSVLDRSELGAVRWKQADVLDPDSLFRLIGAELPDTIFHLAGFASGALARRDPVAALSTNGGGTLNLCMAVLRVRDDSDGYRPRLIVMGSGDVYGDTPAASLSETMPARPVTPYGLSKACQEIVALSFRRSDELEAVVARSFNLVGPGQGWHFAVPDFSRQIAGIARAGAEPVLEVGNLLVERDFTGVRDAVRGLRAIAGLDAPRPLYNVCSGRPTSIRQLVDWIVDEAGVDIELRVAEDRVRPEENERIVGDPSLLRQDAGWEPRQDLEQCVREVYRWVEALVARGTNLETGSGA